MKVYLSFLLSLSILVFALFFPEKRLLEIFSVCAAAVLNSYVIYKMIINFRAEDTVTMVTSLCKLLSFHENNVKLKINLYQILCLIAQA